MRFLFFILPFFSFPFYGYNQMPSINVEALHSDSSKAAFLEEVFKLDQYVRELSDASDLKYNEDRAAYTHGNHLRNVVDSLNQVLIDRYLQLYGYTTNPAWSYKANYAIWTVIHHSSSLAFRLKHFPVLHQAYTDGKINDGDLNFYLCRTLEGIVKFEESCSDTATNRLIEETQKWYDLHH